MGCFLSDISSYLVLEFVSSFSSRSYPPVRKCTDYCGQNMSTNMALKPRTRCYSFDQSLRECNVSLAVNMMNKNCTIFPDRVITTVLLLLCETSCPPQQQEQGLPAAVPGLWTTDAKPHCCWWWCCCPVLLLLWFGHTHAYKNCASELWVEGIHTYHVEGHTKQPRLRSKHALTSTVSQ